MTLPHINEISLVEFDEGISKLFNPVTYLLRYNCAATEIQIVSEFYFLSNYDDHYDYDEMPKNLIIPRNIQNSFSYIMNELLHRRMMSQSRNQSIKNQSICTANFLLCLVSYLCNP